MGGYKYLDIIVLTASSQSFVAKLAIINNY